MGLTDHIPSPRKQFSYPEKKKKKKGVNRKGFLETQTRKSSDLANYSLQGQQTIFIGGSLQKLFAPTSNLSDRLSFQATHRTAIARASQKIWEENFFFFFF